MTKQRQLLTITSIAGMIGTFLPWLNAPIIGSINGTKGDGWISFALFLIALIIVLSGNKEKALSDGKKIGVGVIGLICFIFGIGKIGQLSNIFSQNVSEDNIFYNALTAGTSIGFGIYLITGVGVALVAFPFLFPDKKDILPVSEYSPTTTVEKEQ